MDKTDILFLTVDAFLQMRAGQSPLSPLLNDYEITLGGIDEAHQVPPEVIAACACHMQELIMYFDRAQYIRRTEELVYRHKFAGNYGQQCQEDSEAFNWVRSAGVDVKEVETIWQWIPPESVATLEVTRRCGSAVTKHLRRTSIAYGPPRKAGHSAKQDDGEGGCIWAEGERAGDGADGPRANTKMRATMYENASFHPSSERGHLDELSTTIRARNKEEKKAEKALRVGASRELFLGVLHEGLCQLAAHHQESPSSGEGSAYDVL